MKKNRKKGETAFLKYYEEAWNNRWPALHQALLLSAGSVERKNFWFDENSSLMASYRMDAASLIPAQALEPRSGERVLDMCAAPGGKALVLWELMQGQGELVLADLSRARLNRLRQVIDSYVPLSHRKSIKLFCRDGNAWGLSQRESFDRILVDAPCSGERHLLADPKEMSCWSESRTRSLAKRQYALLCSALLALKSGGRLVYSTCSISPQENESVVQRFLERKADFLRPLSLTFPKGEARESGWFILPDRDCCGPIFLSVFEKK